MDHVVQFRAANAEQSACAVEKMKGHAESMRTYVDKLIAAIEGHRVASPVSEKNRGKLALLKARPRSFNVQ